MCALSDSYQGKVSDSTSRPEVTRAAERDAGQRRKRPKRRKPYDLDSEGEETSDESSSEKVCEIWASDLSVCTMLFIYI